MEIDTGLWIVLVYEVEDLEKKEITKKYVSNSENNELLNMDFPYFKDDVRGNIVFDNKEKALELAEKFIGTALPVYFNANNALVIFGKSF